MTSIIAGYQGTNPIRLTPLFREAAEGNARPVPTDRPKPGANIKPVEAPEKRPSTERAYDGQNHLGHVLDVQG